MACVLFFVIKVSGRGTYDWLASKFVIEKDENGLYGEQGFTEKELDQYIQRKGYEVVIIDDIS